MYFGSKENLWWWLGNETEFERKKSIRSWKKDRKNKERSKIDENPSIKSWIDWLMDLTKRFSRPEALSKRLSSL